MLNTLNQTFRLVDFSRPGSDDFYNSTARARDFLTQQLENLRREHPVTVTCVGHTHIDVAWLWRLKHTREKCARSFSTVNRLMERYKDYSFLQSQPQLYDYIKQDYPDIYEQIKQRVREGRWEAGGAMWVEADCNISSGEALVRQIVYGIRYFEKAFGASNSYLWLPDVFGYSWALPQILQQCDLSTFITTKISWNEFNKLPHDTFTWRGIDGSEVTTHFITTPNDDDPASWYFTYNGLMEPHTVNGVWNKYQDKGINQNMLLVYGYGDGGGGVNRHMLEMQRRMEKMPGLPETKPGRVDDYVATLNDNIYSEHGGYLHTWDGELYLEYHRGTYTSQAYNKKMNRYLELKYRETEFMGALDAALSNSWTGYPQQNLYNGWKIILRNQFHDIIPGSSIREVYEDCRVDYAEADQIADQCQEQLCERLLENQKPDTFSIFNSASWQRDGLVTLPVQDFRGLVRDQQGELLASQPIGEGLLVQLKQQPAMGVSQIQLSDEAVSESVVPFSASEGSLETPFYQLSWNQKGQIDRLYDKENRREVLAAGACANQFQIFEDKPRQYDAWEMEPGYELKQKEVSELLSAEVVSIGNLQIVVKFVWQYGESCITQHMTLYRDSRRIDFKTDINWLEREQLMKVAFPVDIRATEATYDIQFGNVKRPTHKNTSWDHARFEVVGHQWADLSEAGYGVALMNDCKYGYDIHDNVMRLTLLKSSNYPDIEADLGHHEFTYSLMPHSDSWQAAGVVQEAWDLNVPFSARAGSSVLAGRSLLNCDNANILVETVKKAEDSDHLIVRIREFAGSRGTFILSSDFTVNHWQACNMLEKATGELQHSEQIEGVITPYQVHTYKVSISH